MSVRSPSLGKMRQMLKMPLGGFQDSQKKIVRKYLRSRFSEVVKMIGHHL